MFNKCKVISDDHLIIVESVWVHTLLYLFMTLKVFMKRNSYVRVLVV